MFRKIMKYDHKMGFVLSIALFLTCCRESLARGD